ncbi:MAG: response regulator [Planctomycetota bacterium]
MAGGSANGSPRKVLVVDDEPCLRDAICEAFLDEGYDAKGAANGDDARKYLARAAAPDLIVLDLDMPVMDGVAFHAWLRAQRPPLGAVPVLLCSASSRLREVAKELNVSAYLSKPTLPEPLLDTAKRLIDARTA